MRVAYVFLTFGVLAVIVLTPFLVKRYTGRRNSRRFGANLSRSRDPERREADETHVVADAFGESSDPKRLHAHLEIDYQDGNGSWTKRFVRVTEFDNNLDGGILIGHCELRGGRRTFRFDRIKQCVDLETGEAVENVQKYLNDIYSNSAERSVENLRGKPI